MSAPFSTPAADVTLWLRTSGAVTSDATGVIHLTGTNNPNGSTQWTSAIDLWDSFRVEEMALEFFPTQNLSQATTLAAGPLYAVFDPDTTTTLGTTISDYLNYQSMRAFDPNKHWVYHVKEMPRYASASTLIGAYTMYSDGYLDTATPAGIGAIQVLSTGNTVSTTFGQYLLHWKVKFVARH
jgi:hypothetical protein